MCVDVTGLESLSDSASTGRRWLYWTLPAAECRTAHSSRWTQVPADAWEMGANHDTAASLSWQVMLTPVTDCISRTIGYRVVFCAFMLKNKQAGLTETVSMPGLKCLW